MIVFQVLFEVTIEHTYYEDDASTDFQVIPTEGTRKQLRNHGLLFRNTPSGFVVLAEVDETSAGGYVVRRPPERPTRYQFLLKQNTSDFLNYTDLPLNPSGRSIYYFHNLQSNAANGTRYLHPPNKVTRNQQITLKNGIFTTGSKVQESVRLVYDDLSLEYKRKIQDPAGKKVQFDLTNYPNGRAELWADGTKKQTFYTINRRDMSGIFGIVDLFHAASVPSDYRFIAGNETLQKQSYTLSFGRRSTYWKYLLFDRSEKKLENPDIEGGGSSYSFSDVTPGSLDDHRKIFVSDQSIPLKEEGTDSFRLVEKNGGSKKTVLDPLPNPGPETLKRDENDHSKYYSEVYLYI